MSYCIKWQYDSTYYTVIFLYYVEERNTLINKIYEGNELYINIEIIMDISFSTQIQSIQKLLLPLNYKHLSLIIESYS